MPTIMDNYVRHSDHDPNNCEAFECRIHSYDLNYELVCYSDPVCICWRNWIIVGQIYQRFLSFDNFCSFWIQVLVFWVKSWSFFIQVWVQIDAAAKLSSNLISKWLPCIFSFDAGKRKRERERERERENQLWERTKRNLWDQNRDQTN